MKSRFGKRFAQALESPVPVSEDTRDRAFGEAGRLFRERYGAEIHGDAGFRRRVLEDADARRALVDVVEALESLPVKATLANPAFKHIFVDEDPPGPDWRGWYSWGFGETNPLEDWADTWRIPALPDAELRREFITNQWTGKVQVRYRVMIRILKQAGLEVPGE